MEELPFGAYIRQLREAHNMPLRKLAAALDIDTSTLSKIERNERFAKAGMLSIIAETFDVQLIHVKERFWKEKILSDLSNENDAINILERIIIALKTDINK